MRELLDLKNTIISAVVASVIGIIVNGVISYLFESTLIGVIFPVLITLIVLYLAIKFITSHTFALIRKEMEATDALAKKIKKQYEGGTTGIDDKTNKSESIKDFSGESYTFTEKNINKVPNSSGVYGLYQDNNLIYIGRSDLSIRQRLKSHFYGHAGECTRKASKFKYERRYSYYSDAPAIPKLTPSERERELVIKYVKEHGDLPMCNSNSTH